jgi:hypothetical protein
MAVSAVEGCPLCLPTKYINNGDFLSGGPERRENISTVKFLITMEWLNPRQEFWKTELKDFGFHPKEPCTIKVLKLQAEQDVSTTPSASTRRSHTG